MNSLFYDINKKEVIDLVGGIEDLNNKIIRAVGDPSERFQEDRLRILRCFRACSRINGTIDLLTANAIKNDNRLRNINSKEDVSQERIIEEFYKVFEHSINDKYILRRYINLLSIFNMWSEMFPNIDINPHIDIDIVSKPIVFFNLFKGNIKSNIKILNNLKFPTSLINEMIFLEEFNKISVYKLAKLKERFHIDNNLILNFSNDLNFSNKFIKYCEDGFVIDGLDLIDKGFKGAEIEKEKERLELLRFEEY